MRLKTLTTLGLGLMLASGSALAQSSGPVGEGLTGNELLSDQATNVETNAPETDRTDPATGPSDLETGSVSRQNAGSGRVEGKPENAPQPPLQEQVTDTLEGGQNQ